MTAAGCDYVSDGRFMLGLGASGPQVIEGFHGVKYEKPMQRIKEYIEACRMIWKREEKFDYQGKTFQAPLPPGEGTGLGKPLKLINHPVAQRDPDLVGEPEGAQRRRRPPRSPTAGCRSCSSPRSSSTCGAIS